MAALLAFTAYRLLRCLDRPTAPRIWDGARQDDMDALTIKLFHLRASLRPKARVAAAKMEQWHRDPASDGRGGEVVQLVRPRRPRRHGC